VSRLSESKKKKRIILELLIFASLTYGTINLLTMNHEYLGPVGVVVYLLFFWMIWLVRLVWLAIRGYRRLTTDDAHHRPAGFNIAGDSTNPASKSPPPDAPPGPGRT